MNIATINEIMKVNLVVGEDLDFTLADGTEVSFFWHEPSINLNWYPIAQIDAPNGKEIFWKEGTENPQYWNNLVEQVCCRLKELNLTK